MNDTKTTKLETVTCGRCGGTGEYSYNQMHGSTCYGCSGGKVVFTKKGKAAHDFLKGLRSKRAGDLKVGDSPQQEDFFRGARGFYKIEKIDVVDTIEKATSTWTDKVTGEKMFNKGYIRATMTNAKLGTITRDLDPESLVRVAQTGEQKVETFKQALEYQAKLTKKGELMKKFQK